MGMVGQIGCRYWGAFAAIYKCVDKWKPRQRRKSVDPRSFRFLQAKQSVRKNRCNLFIFDIFHILTN
ncbi:hypothetical protein WUBG_15934 [Wuchereria bancrofti]|uniref:Uncharacterized protein n=1 Tax=Wuchereria bancrofti TaxID=6293 RepID=J9DU14_WUCBA|nr:hypothetical protein WUBG_15934 [Wuchereria bancrofti]